MGHGGAVMRTMLWLAAMAMPGAAQAQDCDPVPADLSAWTAGASAAATADAASAPAIAIGRAAEVTLHPAAHLTPATPPGRAAKPGSHAGLIAFDVATAGTYRVALSNAAWIDVVAGGAALESATHGHGPRCSGMRKLVAFALRPGRHLLQVSGSPDASVRVLVVPPA